MRMFLFIALLIGFLASEAKATSVVLVVFVCKTEQAIHGIAEQDEISVERAKAYLANLISERVCVVLNPPAILPIGRVIKSYTDSKGIISEIRAVTSPHTGREWFTITADAKQHKRGSEIGHGK